MPAAFAETEKFYITCGEHGDITVNSDNVDIDTQKVRGLNCYINITSSNGHKMVVVIGKETKKGNEVNFITDLHT